MSCKRGNTALVPSWQSAEDCNSNTDGIIITSGALCASGFPEKAVDAHAGYLVVEDFGAACGCVAVGELLHDLGPESIPQYQLSCDLQLQGGNGSNAR